MDQGDSGIYFNGIEILPSGTNSAILFARKVLGSGPKDIAKTKVLSSSEAFQKALEIKAKFLFECVCRVDSTRAGR